MFKYYLQGFLLGLAYVAPIGMQNLYVINTAARMNRFRAYQVALITIFFDISLALASFFGIGVILENIPVLRGVVLLAGSIAVIYIGIGLVRSTPSTSKDVNVNETLLKIVGICFTVTWLNPQAIIDGSLLLGGFKASLPNFVSKFFIAGVATASATWFLGLATVVSIFKNILNDKVLRVINIVCGSVIIFYGIKLIISFIKLVF